MSHLIPVLSSATGTATRRKTVRPVKAMASAHTKSTDTTVKREVLRKNLVFLAKDD